MICALSGGVDSTVAATLVHQVLGGRLHCVFVDNGLLRYKVWPQPPLTAPLQADAVRAGEPVLLATPATPCYACMLGGN